MRSAPRRFRVHSRRKSPVAWKLLMGALLPTLCIGMGSVAFAARPTGT